MTYDMIFQWIVDLLMFFLLYLIVTMNLNFMYGYTGIPHFGISLSVAGGGYVVGALTGRILRWLYNVYPQLDFMYENSKITDEINVHQLPDYSPDRYGRGNTGHRDELLSAGRWDFLGPRS